MRKIFILIILPLISFSQTDSIAEISVNQLDSLLMSFWYVKNSQKKYHSFDTIKNLDHYINVPDSVIVERLKKIPTVIPLTYNNKVRAWIELYIKKYRLIPTYLSLGEYYFPIFEQILDKYNLPYQLKYLPLIESALNPRARSRAGAVGLWQFLYSTSQLYHLEVNDYVDERMDVIKSTEAAAKYLSQMYKNYHDWLLVIAAYNCGPANVNKAIRRAKKTDFWEIYPYLPRETREYVPAFIAITYLMTYAKEHNFYPVKIDLPINTDTVMIDDTLHLMQVAEVLQIPIEQLRDLNPQYKRDIIPGFLKPYPLRLPADKVLAFIDLKDSIFNYKDSVFFKNKTLIVKNISYPKNVYHKRKCPSYNLKGKAKLYYTVKPGDTFSEIAQWYNVSVFDLKCWNNRTSNRLRVGEKLLVYVPVSKVTYYRRINVMSEAQKQNLVSRRYQKSYNLDKNYVYHKIQHGETIYDIAKIYGVSYKQILALNNMTERQARRLREGQIIKVKRK